MKKILFLLLLAVSGYGQVETGQQQDLDYGMKIPIDTLQTITTPSYLGTFGNTGVIGKIPSAYIEKTDNKQNSLAIDGTGTKYPTVDAVNAALPKTYATIVYVNTTSPTTATVFDDENPPVVNDNVLKTNVANLYIGTDGSKWVYKTSPAGYVTEIVPDGSNFYLYNTTTDAGNNKTSFISRTGGIKTTGTLEGNTVRGMSLYLDGETTNTIAGFDGARQLKSLPTITYPSLTELSYVKGVNSGIQSQINGKQNVLTNPVTGTGTANYIAKFTGSGTLGNSIMSQDGNGGMVIDGASEAGYLHMKAAGVSKWVFGGNSGETNSNFNLFNFTTLSINFSVKEATGNASFSNDLSVGGALSATALTLTTDPTTSSGTYDFVTRNTTTGVLEKVSSNTIATTASPTFTGTPTAPTAAVGTNTPQIATMEALQAAVTSNIAQTITNGVTTSAPSQDAVFDALALKADLSGAVFTGFLESATLKTAGNLTFTNTGTGLSTASTNFVQNNPGTPGWTSSGSITAIFYTTTVYTVATLPAITSGTAYATVSDATAPTYLGTLTGGGTVVCPVFYNGTAWVSH